MNKLAIELNKWKWRALNGLGPTERSIMEHVMNNDIPHRHQEIEDLPPEIKCDDEICHLHVSYDKSIFGENWPWVIQYRNDKGEVKIQAGSTTLDWAISNMMNNFRHQRITTLDGKLYRHFALHNKRDISIVDKRFKLTTYPTDENGHILWKTTCPYCNSENVKTEHYRSSPESWQALAGRDGYSYDCQDCDYKWNVDHIVS